MTKRGVVYARASLDLTGEGRSVDRQTEAVRKLLEGRGIEIVAELADNSISAYGDKERPAWKKVLGMIERREIDYVAAWHLDRMTRSMIDLERLIMLTEASGVGILTATGDMDLTTDVGRMVARILAAVARAEVERKAARQKLANRQLAGSGQPWTGGARPFGYEDDQATVVPLEAEAIRWGAQAALDGTTMSDIAREWEARGLVSSRAKYAKQGWTGRGVKAVLVSPRYAGLRQYRGEVVGTGTWPAILDEETHLALRSKLEDPVRLTRRNGRGGKVPTTLLSKIMLCEPCSERVNGSSLKRMPSYTCSHGHVHVPRDIADREVRAAILGLLVQPSFLSTLVVAAGGDEKADLVADLDALRRRMKILAQGFADGTVEESTFLGVAQSLRERISSLENELTAVQGGSVVDGLSVGKAKIVQEWDGLTLERQRLIIETFLIVVARPQLAKKRKGFRAEEQLTVTAKHNGPTLAVAEDGAAS